MLELNHDGNNMEEIFNIDIKSIKAGTKKSEDYPTRLLAAASVYLYLPLGEMNALASTVEALTGVAIGTRSGLIQYLDRAIPNEEKFLKLCAELTYEYSTSKPKTTIVAVGSVEEAIEKIKDLTEN